MGLVLDLRAELAGIDFLGYDVVLARSVNAGEIVYGASVTLLTTASMRLLGERLGRVKDAVQPGRRIATVRPDACGGLALALITPRRSRAFRGRLVSGLACC